MPPSRFIFHGAEVPADSPLPSPGSNEHLMSDSSSSESESSASSSHAADSDKEADVSGYGSESSTDDQVVTSSSLVTNQNLLLITGGLCNYSCASEENSRPSSDDADELLTTEPQTAIGLQDIETFFGPTDDDDKLEDLGEDAVASCGVSTKHFVADGAEVCAGKIDDDLSSSCHIRTHNEMKELLDNVHDNPS